jgi:multidrug efflux system membrane fusion protein
MTPPMDDDRATAAPLPRGRRSIIIGCVAVVCVLALGALIVSRTHHRAGGTSAEAAKTPGGTPGSAPGSAASAADRPVPVLLARVATRDVPITLEGLGTVTALQTVNVHSQVEGRLLRVGFKEGQAVRRGELLAEIDPRPFVIQLHQAEAALVRDEAQLRGAERNLERYAAVSAERLIPQQQTDDQRTLVEQLRGTIQTDRTQVENARLQLDYARIRSPIDGVSGIRQIDPGNVVHVADPTGIVVVTQMDPIAVIFTLPQDDLTRVAQQQAKAPLVVEALSRDGTEALGTGTLALIDNQINQTTATLRLKAVFPNPDRSLWPNQFVRTRVRLDVRKGVLVIPAVAVQRGPQGTYAYVVGQTERAEQRPIVVDAIEGEQAMVSRGVTAGERVVIEGHSQLRPGARVLARQDGQGQGQGKGKGQDRGKGQDANGGGAGGETARAASPPRAAQGAGGSSGGYTVRPRRPGGTTAEASGMVP